MIGTDCLGSNACSHHVRRHGVDIPADRRAVEMPTYEHRAINSGFRPRPETEGLSMVISVNWARGAESMFLFDT